MNYHRLCAGGFYPRKRNLHIFVVSLPPLLPNSIYLYFTSFRIFHHIFNPSFLSKI